jgi:hypothetical protein
LGVIANEHADRLLEHLDDRFFAKHGIPKDRLPEIQDFIKFGRVGTSDVATRELINLLKPEFQGIFPKLSEETRNWLVEEVDTGRRSLNWAEEQIRKEGLLLAIEAERAEAKQREAEAATSAAEQRATDRANQEIARFENTFVEAQSRKHGVDVEMVRDWVARVAAELDHAAQMDPKHAAKLAWDELKQACASGNDMRIKPAMSKLQILVEQGVDELLGRRSKAPAPTIGQQPPGQPPGQPTASLRQQQSPQFTPDNPNKAEDWSKVGLDDYLFGRATPAAR